MTSDDSASLDIDGFTEGVWEAIPILRDMGLRLVDVAPGRAAATIPLGPNRNHIGTVYAGSLFSVAEMLGGVIGLVTFDAGRFFPVVKQVTIRFAKPARTTVRAAASLTPDEVTRIGEDATRDGRAEFVLETAVTDEDGTTVAEVSGVYQLRRIDG